MPRGANAHLRFVEYRDFTGGLWTRETFDMPPNALQQMDNCYALPGGGVRAWYKRESTISRSGLDAGGVTEVVVGVFLRGNLFNGSGTAGATRAILTWRASDKKHRLYVWNWELSDTAFVVKQTTTAATSAATFMHDLRHFHDSSNVNWIIYTTGSNGSTNAGLWKYNTATGAVTQIGSTTYTGPLTIAQARILVADGGSLPSRIEFTEPGSTTAPDADNYQDFEPNQIGEQIRLLEAFSPSDIVIGKDGAPWVNVQGAIDVPTVLQMGAANTPGPYNQHGVITPNGIVFMEESGTYYVTPNGNTFEPLSEQLAPFGAVSSEQMVGQPAYYDHWLFAPGGLVRNYETNSWFKVTDLASAAWYVVDAHTAKLMAIDSGAAYVISEYDVSLDATRVSAYTLKTAPLHTDDGRTMNVREVQVFCESYHASSSVTVTVGGVARAVSAIGTGKQITRHLFPRSVTDEMLDVTVTVNGSTAEAPKIERVRVGVREGNLV